MDGIDDILDFFRVPGIYPDVKDKQQTACQKYEA
jgi:hypothetical protein